LADLWGGSATRGHVRSERVSRFFDATNSMRDWGQPPPTKPLEFKAPATLYGAQPDGLCVVRVLELNLDRIGFQHERLGSPQEVPQRGRPCAVTCSRSVDRRRARHRLADFAVNAALRPDPATAPPPARTSARPFRCRRREASPDNLQAPDRLQPPCAGPLCLPSRFAGH
jgi:hypothetical protein